MKRPTNEKPKTVANRLWKHDGTSIQRMTNKELQAYVAEACASYPRFYQLGVEEYIRQKLRERARPAI